MRRGKLLFTTVAAAAASSSLAYDAESPVLCDAEMNLFCPPSTSCCPTFKSKLEPEVIVGYSCLISWSTRYPQGPCCPHFEEDDDVIATNTSPWGGGTGCAVGYECASSSPEFIMPSFLRQKSDQMDVSRTLNTHNVEENYCKINSTAHPIDNQGRPIKNKYETMPRYRACESFTKDSVDVYGLPIPLLAALAYKSSSSLTKNDLEKQYMGQLAYYSNMGQITADDRMDSDIKRAVIGVHGSGRDAGTYLCALTATVADASKNQMFTTKDQRRLLSKDVLVVAPWFMAPEDNTPPTSSSPIPYIQWDDHHPIPHTFRYGAESKPDVKYNMTVSSFAAMDVLLEHLCDRKRFPNLRRVVVVGHSAGGQFVQRWALSSNSWCFRDGQFASRFAETELPQVRVVVANPRSFAYLDNRRYFALSDEAAETDDDGVSPSENDGTLTPFDKYQLRPPSAAEEDSCKEFNRYEWGLDENLEVPAPYVINNVQKLISHGVSSELFCRYASRDVVYLSGQRDVGTLGSQICDQGKEDGYQGPSRRERSERFFEALQTQKGEVETCGRNGGVSTNVHERHVVKNVGHDHGLIFQSPEGIHAMFGENST
eukprot:CAMPEP_0201691564 /NCGR_PEP_ID=MMETSP0578-20130828/4704_1 /ASSEMBLY_ACC=CAM_ASM_000663 /TAXON_ID=267565 /ORGANISM="Skeletonema grethea, Strain CCMP 1804" /LENGTH=597 /DNA_ID=CAMNT_0048176799 /DNA_START=22 /DNA_END=1815 /DNA_ORIENTATION=+